MSTDKLCADPSFESSNHMQRASNYRLGGKDTGEDVREEMLCTGRLMRILYTLSVACKSVCVCLCSKEMQEVKLL